MLLIQSGANLNILNDYGQTPIAFGSENLLSILDLKSAVATFDGKGVLPEAYDNSRFLKKNVKAHRDKGGLFFNYEPLNSAGEDLTQKNGPVKAFVRKGERLTID
jgi:hypothetical protein